MGDRKKILVVCGPTATGKSSLALALAQRFRGELIAADSMQIYQGLVIGTAATTPEEAGGTPLHLSGFLPPEKSFSVANWVAQAAQAVEDIAQRGGLPVVCGGTGLYIQSLVKGIDFAETAQEDGLQNALYAQWEAEGAQAMLDKLAGLDPDRAEKLHLNDKKRILRALEMSLRTGQTAAQREKLSQPEQAPFDTFLLGLRFQQREVMYNSINIRVDAMMEAGLLKEAEVVWQNRQSYQTAAQAIGYKEFFPYFEGESPLAPCVEKLKQATRNYAKRQLTWFGRMEGICWLDADAPDLTNASAELVQAFLSRHG